MEPYDKSHRHTQLVLLDTSFLLTALRQRIDTQSELRKILHGPSRTAVLDIVVYELEHLVRASSWKTNRLARVALSLISKGVLKTSISQIAFPEVDISILACALTERTPVIVATVDSGLRDLLRLNGVPYISLKGRTQIALSPGARAKPT